jgi:pimeloyl-ACP methyl ester carboxylesterase
VTFRFLLRDIIYTSQRRHNEGVLKHPLRKYRREPVYREIMQYSYEDYFEKFAAPYYQERGMTNAAETLKSAGDLRSYDAGLRGNPKIRVMANENDFLLTKEDLAWLHATFPAGQLTVFPEGGHLGNLVNPTVQKTILDNLSGMK